MPKRLDAAWGSVRQGSSSRSKGPDGITLGEFSRNWHLHRDAIRNQLRGNCYIFGGYLGHAIAKAGPRDPPSLKSFRPISVANIRDRVVQRAILEAIWPDIRDRVVTKSSFGGVRRYAQSSRNVQPDDNDRRCIKRAANKIFSLRQSGFCWIFETDIVDFFSSIDKVSLLESLAGALRDQSLVKVISDSLSTEVTNAGQLGFRAGLWNSLWGVPQGGVLSPALANFYLFALDKAMEREGFKVIRYVDDLIILARDEPEATAAHDLCLETLSELRLKIHPLGENSKTRIIAPNKPFRFLGLEFSARSIRPTLEKFAKLTDSIDSITDPRRRNQLTGVIQELNWLVLGFMSAYDFCNLTQNELAIFDSRIGFRVRQWMCRRGIIRNVRHVTSDAFAYLGIKRFSDRLLNPIVDRARPGELVKSESHATNAM
ncbi:reverse transcriptase domain-containing protein [Lacipirellula sp.]|uniref:reverse transcriptase domain-containing protein n=1 Tax=Lacipirellula sp. TaxID=2691419 RepID=UPI003D0D2AE8